MRKIILVTGLLTALTSFAFSQCPTAGFSMPDSVCAGAAFQVTNTSTPGMNNYWDLCTGDLTEVPINSNLTVSTGLSFAQQMKMITENGNFYIFIANYLSNNILRYDFGNSLDNTPVVYDYGSIGVIFQPCGLDVIKENGNWYALVSSFSQNNIVRVDFGTTISNNTATAVNLGLFNLNTPKAIKIAKDGNDYYAFVSNATSNDLTKISFGNSITNTPAGFSALTNPSFDGNWGIDAVYDCSLGKWLVFYASSTLSKINIIDFGNTLSNIGVLASSISCVTNPSGISLNRDGSNWHLFINGFGTLEFQNMQFSGNLLDPPSLVQTYNNLGLTSPRFFAVYRDSTNFKAFITLNLPDQIKKLVFETPCSTNPAVSYDPAGPIVISSLNNQYQHISLEVTGTDGLTSYYNDSVFVREAPEAGFINTFGCEGQTVSFTDTSIIDSNLVTTWQWDFGDSSPVSNDQNPVHLFPGTNNYVVTLTTTYSTGCFDEFSATVAVSPIPSADFSFVNNQCSGLPVSFTDLSQAFAGANIVSWQWNFGDTTAIDTLQNPGHIYAFPGNYIVTLTVVASTGCIDTITQSISILPAPVAGFTTDATCVGETVSFTNTTTIAGGGAISSNWDFGDTFNSIQTSPTHQYLPAAANYDVTLIATALSGCTDTIVTNIRIAEKPVPNFTWTPQIVCKFNQVSFTSTSIGTGSDTIATYFWNFGDTQSSTDENPFHSYSDTGYYNVTLTVMSLTACDSSITQQLYVIPSPTASFTASNVCLGLSSTFNPSTTTPAGTQVDSIVWSFGDGTTLNSLSSPTHLYNAPDQYIVTMTVYNNLLCTASYVDSVDVYPIPTANFTTSILCSDSTAVFDGTLSFVNNDSITSWLWNYGNIGTGTGSLSMFSFPDSGFYDVTLIVTTQNGCNDTSIQTLSVILSPEFDFTFNEPCLGLASNFTYLPNINQTPNAILSWTFGDGTSSGQLNPSHIYATVDTFNVSLRVQHNATGCVTTLIKPLIIKPYPDAGFSLINNCEYLPVQFNDTSSISTGTIASWNWDFGAFGNASTQNATISVTDAGTYPVSLTVTSNQGCTSDTTSSFTVFANPVAGFTTDPLFGSPPLVVNYINNTTGANNYIWYFGDGNNGTGFNPVHTYQDTGIYNISLVAASVDGCIDTAYAAISVLIPYLDIAVTKVFVTQNDNLLGITAEFLNTGNIPVSSIRIASTIENGSAINEDWSGDLQPGKKLYYEFIASYDMNNRSLPGYYCVEAISPNNAIDENPENNNKCGVLGSSFEVYSAYPNPFNNQVSLSFNLPLEDIFTIRVHDYIGKLVFLQENQTGFIGYNTITIPTTNLRKGVYAITIEYRDDLKVKNIMKY